MISYTVNGNELIVNNKPVKFNYPIYKIDEVNNLIIVLLEFNSKNNPLEFINALYAISDSGKIVWKMEDVRNHLGNLQPDPLVDFKILDDKILAIDFCSRKFNVNAHDGSISGFQTGRW